MNLKTTKISFFLCILIAVISCNNSKIDSKQNTKTVIYNKDSTTVKFNGVITNAKNDCWSDGTCSIEVNNKWVVEISYGLREPGTIPNKREVATGIVFSKDNESIGKKVKVYAAIKEKNILTLEGDNTYYIEILKTK